MEVPEEKLGTSLDSNPVQSRQMLVTTELPETPHMHLLLTGLYTYTYMLFFNISNCLAKGLGCGGKGGRKEGAKDWAY